MIKKLCLNVPGQKNFDTEDNDKPDSTDIGNLNRGTLEESIIQALGGKDNINDIDACATRLRVDIRDMKSVRSDAFKALGASGVVSMGNGIQIIYGPKAALLCEQIKEVMKGNVVTGTVLDKPGAETIIKEESIVCPMDGVIHQISDVPDRTFSEEILGCGFAVTPDGGDIVSPVNGTVMTVFPTKHAIGLMSEGGREILIHLGIDTVKLEGAPFEIFVNEGDCVKAGQVISRMDIELIKKAGYECISPIIFTNMRGWTVNINKQGRVSAGDKDIVRFKMKQQED